MSGPHFNSPKPGQPGPGRQVQIPACLVMFNGLKAEYHIKKLIQKRAECPFDAGMDLYASPTEPEAELFACGYRFKLNTNLVLVPAVGTFGYVHERSSSLAHLAGGRVRSGVIDSGYTGEIMVEVTCPREQRDVVLAAIKVMQDKEIAIAQLIFIPCLGAVFQPVPPGARPIIGRGNRGYGSTDKPIET